MRQEGPQGRRSNTCAVQKAKQVPTGFLEGKGPIYAMTQSQQPLVYLDLVLLTCSVCELFSFLESEVQLVWRGRRNASQICYIVARHICIASFVLYVATDICHQSRVLRDRRFIKNKGLIHWLLNMNLLFVEITFSLRTWALWEQSRTVGFWLIAFIVLLWGSTFGILTTTTTRVTRFIILYYYFIPLTVFYLVIMVLVAVKAYEIRHELNTSFVRLVHAQGLTYYILLFTMSLSALIIVFLRCSNLLDYAERVVQFVFTHMACRMSLSLRAQSSRTVIDLNSGRLGLSERDTAIPTSNLNFRHTSAHAME